MRRNKSDWAGSKAKPVKVAAEDIVLQPWHIVEVEGALKEAEAGNFASDKEVRAMFNEFC